MMVYLNPVNDSINYIVSLAFAKLKYDILDLISPILEFIEK